MTSGIYNKMSGLFRSHKPVERTKSEAPVETRANNRKEDAKRTSTTSKLKSLIKRSASTATPGRRRTGKKFDERNPQDNRTQLPAGKLTQPQKMTQFGFPDVEDAYFRTKQTLAELRELGEGFDDDPEAAVNELKEVIQTSSNSTKISFKPELSPPARGAPLADEIKSDAELEAEINLSLQRLNVMNDYEILASFMPKNMEADITKLDEFLAEPPKIIGKTVQEAESPLEAKAVKTPPKPLPKSPNVNSAPKASGSGQ